MTPEAPSEPEIPVDQLVATSLLRGAMHIGGERLSVFSGWLLAGIAATFGLVLSNLDTLLRFASIHELRRALLALVLALIVGVLGRYVGMIASSGAAAGEWGSTLAPHPDLPVDYAAVFRLVSQRTWPPARWILARQLRNLNEGDLLGANAFLFNAAQLHALLVLLTALIALGALGYISVCLAV